MSRRARSCARKWRRAPERVMDNGRESDLKPAAQATAPRPRRRPRQVIWSRDAVLSIRLVTELVVRQLDVDRCGVWALPDGEDEPLCVDVYLRHGASHVREPLRGTDESALLRERLRQSALVVVPGLGHHADDLALLGEAASLLPTGTGGRLAAGLYRGDCLSAMLVAEQRGARRDWNEHDVRVMQRMAAVVRDIVGDDEPTMTDRIGRSFVDGLPIVAYRCALSDRGWIISDVTEGAERILERPAAHFIGGRLEDLRRAMSDRSPDPHGSAVAELPPGLPTFEYHHRRALLDGSVRHFLEKGSLSVDPATQQPQIDGVVIEYVPPQAAAPAESAGTATVGRLLSELGHELRTPLNAILGLAQLLELAPPPADDQQHAHAAQIRRAGLYMLDLIDETLDLSRVEAGELELDQHTVELASIVDAALPLVAPQAASAGVEIVAPSALAGVQVHCDPRRLRQVLVNLLSNAIAYNRRGGRVELAVAADAHGVRLRVTDIGVGMTEQQIGSLFRSFEHLGTEHTGIQGAGLGLVITQRLLQAMGGMIEVRSEPSIGSTFEVWLPRP
jgi:signal transduction histidine kinase